MSAPSLSSAWLATWTDRVSGTYCPRQRRVSLHVHGIHNGVAGQQLDGNVSPLRLRGEVQWSPPSRVTSTYVRPGVEPSPNSSQITRRRGIVQR